MKNLIHYNAKYCFWPLFIILFSFFIPIMGSIAAAPFNTTIPTVKDPKYEIQIFVPGSHFHGIHGITFDNNDKLYAGSVIGQTVYVVDTNTSEVKELIGPPKGNADDLEFGPDGRLYYTSVLSGILRVRESDGKIVDLAEGLTGINSLAFNSQGRLFATQVFTGDALHEIDLTGNKKTRKIIENVGWLNGFDFGPDDKLYGPLIKKRSIGRVDVETGQIEIVADGFQAPAAANFDSKGNLYAIDSAAGEVIQVDIETGKKALIAKVDPYIDNLALDSKDRLFISNMAKNGIYEIDKKSGKSRVIVEGKISCAAGVAVASDDNGETVYLTDFFSYKKVDGFTGEVSLLNWHGETFLSIYPVTISIKNSYAIITSYLSGAIQIIDLKTNQTKKVIGGFNAPSHAIMIDDGSIIVAEMGTGNILKVVTDNEGDHRDVIAAGLQIPTYLADSGNNSVFVTEALSGNITKISLESGNKTVIASGLQMPEGVAILPDGNLVAVESGKGQMVKVNPSTGDISLFVINLPVGFPGYPEGPPPFLITGVAVSKAGIIYVTGDKENVLYKIMPK